MPDILFRKTWLDPAVSFVTLETKTPQTRLTQTTAECPLEHMP